MGLSDHWRRGRGSPSRPRAHPHPRAHPPGARAEPQLLPTASRLPDPGQQTASWVVQIVAGLLSGILGVHGFIILYYNNRFSYLLHIWKASIWTGVVAVLAGVAAFIYEKRGGIFWALLRTLLTLAAFATTTAAIYLGAYHFQDPLYTFRDEYCGIPESWEPTLPLSPPEKAILCLSYVHMLVPRLMGLMAMLLSIWVLLILVSLFPLFLYCWRRCQPKEEGDHKALLEVSET
ncbi:transmembrane protein 176A [Saccopteryx bilineata]|uniref:transmembrane protein 176A n=1 Tax=Saccopteryx bilineata TaxID=59482 RepID=UPI0033903F65